MKRLPLQVFLFSLFFISAVKMASAANYFQTNGADSSKVVIALAGNAYLTQRVPGPTERISGQGLENWSNPEAITSIYFKVSQPGTLNLSLRMKVSAGKSYFKVSSGNQHFSLEASNTEFDTLAVGELKVSKNGYIKIDIQGLRSTGKGFGEISHLIVEAEGIRNHIAYVENNEGNRYYWGRRGPSVHLGYIVPEKIINDVEYFYSEVNVPQGMDPIGSYFQANGFGEGYFGMQVNGVEERRILFSLWSPFVTDDPSSIPDSLQIKLIKKGKNVKTGEFGNEGSGGQSYLVYPWEAGKTYAFLTRAQPDVKSNTTTYTSYFKPANGSWMLIASFKRPATNTRLRSLYAFVENFNPEMGHLERRANFSNQWVREVKGTWTEITEARFTGDDIANRAFRKDVGGGVDGIQFYLKNGGFFDDSTPLKTKLSRPSTRKTAPSIDFSQLP